MSEVASLVDGETIEDLQRKAAAAEEKVTEEAVASEGDSEAEEVVEEAIDQAEVEGEQIPVSTAAEEETLGDRYKKAFSIDNFDIKL